MAEGQSGQQQQRTARHVGLQVASYSIRVDHPEDRNTIHDWPLRRMLVASTISSLGADVVSLQEISPVQKHDLQIDLGPEWGVDVKECDPTGWAGQDRTRPDAGPNDGQAREGNGVAWRKDRLCFVSSSSFWLGPSPDKPTMFGGSGYLHTCHVSKFTDLYTGKLVVVYSTHFDPAGDDSMSTGGATARREAAQLVMSRALEEQKETKGKKKAELADVVIVSGNFNTFEDRQGATYSALRSSSEEKFVDVREAPFVIHADHGRGGGSWEGWETNQFCRAAIGGELRYDQIFVSMGTPVYRTSVMEERYIVPFQGYHQAVYASDHLPVVAEIGLPASKKMRVTIMAEAMGRAPKSTIGARSTICLVIFILLVVLFVFIFLWILWDAVVNGNLECRLECRNRLRDPPFDAQLFANLSCVPRETSPNPFEAELGSGAGSS